MESLDSSFKPGDNNNNSQDTKQGPKLAKG